MYIEIIKGIYSYNISIYHTNCYAIQRENISLLCLKYFASLLSKLDVWWRTNRYFSLAVVLTP